LPSITCARCDAVFVPSTGQLLAPAVPDDSPAEYSPPPPPVRRGVGLVVGGVVALTLLLIVIVVATRPRPKAKAPAPTPTAPVVKREATPEENLDKIIDRETDRASAELFGITMGIIGWIVCVSVVYFAVAILIIVVLAKDVRARAPDQVPLWCLLFLLGGFFAVVFWLAARPPLREERRFDAGPPRGPDPYF
jgi:hypothetical protein